MKIEKINESKSKIKYLMNFDSSKTMSENQESILLEEEVDIILNEQKWRETLKKRWDPKHPGNLFQKEGGYRPIFGDWKTPEGEKSIPDTEGCPNQLSYRQVERAIYNVAHHIKLMNTIFIKKSSGIDKSAQKIFQNIRFIYGKNVYNEDFDECTPAIEIGKDMFLVEFRDWFSKGETLESEITQLINSKTFKNRTLVLKYLNATLKMLETSDETIEPGDETIKPGDEITKPESEPSKLKTVSDKVKKILPDKKREIKRAKPISKFAASTVDAANKNLSSYNKMSLSKLAPPPKMPALSNRPQSKLQKWDEKAQVAKSKWDEKAQAEKNKWDEKAQAAKSKWDDRAQAAKDKFQPRIDKIAAKEKYKQTKADAKSEYLKAKERAKA